MTRRISPADQSADRAERAAERTRQAIRRRAPGGAQRAAQAAACRRCGRPTMRGLDADGPNGAAVAVAVDVAPLSAAGELLALLAGRTTFALVWFAGRGRYEIDRRGPIDISAHPPGTVVNCDVVAEHKCHAEPLDVLKTAHSHAQIVSMPRMPPF